MSAVLPSQFSHGTMRILLANFILTFGAASMAEEPGFISPDKTFVVASIKDVHRNDSYAIQTTKGSKVLAICPDDARFSASPSAVAWSPDSRIVAVHTRETRHGGAADIWLVEMSGASPIATQYPPEMGNFYFTPKRWLNANDLEFEVIGVLDPKHAPDPENSAKAYTFVLRIDRKTKKGVVVNMTKPQYGHF